MKIRVNGEKIDMDEGITVEGLLMRLDINTEGIAVELNEAIVPRTRHGDTILKENDTLEIVRMIGGG